MGHEGKTRSEGELARVVRMRNSLMEVAPSLSFNQAVNFTSKVELISQKTIRHRMKLLNDHYQLGAYALLPFDPTVLTACFERMHQ